ncbi:putative membrane protein [Desulfitobacterium dichloroeliminans LMG P-21439]|uniref:Putative membrane protein n=1 Tax=Desulfitobacterium dichloroeliminans (strain LMG P-21439 / DCA1) TaxID=871963 RepID=L0FE25_DESDL|nr:membrane protein [Desulfitobacterium dichloroeliminans]AGA70906.1 putative membrane protein [Desulfitobacterium dichloroeliminans LMG P-21439]
MHIKIAFQVAATYIGAVMGAGFASGQEIQQFFANFGGKGIFGILISAALFSILGWMMIDLQRRWKVSSYMEFFARLFGEKWGARMEILISLLLFIGMTAMMSGAGAVFQQYFELSSWVGIILTALVIAIALWFRGEGILWINTMLIPLKFIFCLGIALLAILFAEGTKGVNVEIVSNPMIQSWVFSGVLYVSFNLTLAMVVFASLGKEIQKPEARIGAVFGGMALGVFALVIYMALLRFPEVRGYEIPMVAVAGRLGSWAAFFYVVVLWLAMLTAAIGNGFSLVNNIEKKYKINYRTSIIFLLLIIIPLSGVQFSFIVKTVYPLFGYLGLIFIPVLIWKYRKT